MSARWQPAARIATAATVCGSLFFGAILTRNALVGEAAQASAFMAEAHRALARNDRGVAVLALERAAWLAPRTEEVRSALAAASVNEARPPLARALGRVSAVEWLAAAIAAGWLAALGLSLVLARRRRGDRWVLLAAGTVFVVAMAAMLESSAEPLAVVIGRDARLRLAPYSAASDGGPLPSGTVVVIGSRYGEFIHVALGDGAAGWVPASAIERVAAPET